VRILVAEDESKLAARLVTSLGDAGYAVDCAADGERAQILGHDEEYDAVVLDLESDKFSGQFRFDFA
jgi:two-component system, OmpR family, response regulator